MKLFLVILLINVVVFVSTFIICACKVASEVDDIIDREDYKESGVK